MVTQASGKPQGRGPGGPPRHPSPLIYFWTKLKKSFGDWAPPYLRIWMTAPAPAPIRHCRLTVISVCMRLVGGDFNSYEVLLVLFSLDTHEGFCSRSMLQGHAPGAQLLRVYQRFHGYTSSS